jgi:hypothetical protein
MIRYFVLRPLLKDEKVKPNSKEEEEEEDVSKKKLARRKVTPKKW